MGCHSLLESSFSDNFHLLFLIYWDAFDVIVTPLHHMSVLVWHSVSELSLSVNFLLFILAYLRELDAIIVPLHYTSVLGT